MGYNTCTRQLRSTLSLLSGCLSVINTAVYACTPGQYSTYSGDCMTCPKGTYGETPTSYKCVSCPGEKTTISEGATSTADCVYDERGCYYNMSLGNDTWLALPNTDKLRTCMRHCSELGHLYAAIQNASSCFCTQAISGTIFPSGCSVQCDDPTKACGGVDTWTVYRTGKRKASITTIGATEVDLAAHGLNVSGMAEFEFKVLACQDAHVRLMNDRGNYTTNFLEIVIGVSDNEYFTVRDEKYGLGMFNVFGTFLDCYSWKFFRISWNNGTITIFVNDTNNSYSRDIGVVFDVNHLVLSAYGTIQVCWQVFADIQRNEECPPLPTTTSVTIETTEATESCLCPCSNTNITEEALQEKIAEIKRTLTVDVKTTSQYERKFVCADDPRPSAKSVGILFGPILISMILGLIVLADFPRLIKSVTKCKKSIGRLRSEWKSKNKNQNETVSSEKKYSLEEKTNTQEDGKESASYQKTNLNLKSQPNFDQNQKKINNMKQTKWSSNSTQNHRNTHADQRKAINASHRHFRNNLQNSRSKQNVKGDLKNCDKPSNLSTQLNNQKPDKGNEIDPVKKIIRNTAKETGAKKPPINNLKTDKETIRSVDKS